ncbi:MAG: hypothetical protein ABSF74_01725 [Dehalococcoidia bacterium]|jgi:hypothetical protein
MELDEVRLRTIYDQQRAHGCFLEWPEWNEKVKKAYFELVKAARNKTEIQYGELGRLIGIPTFPDYEWFHLKIAWILGACSEYELEDGHPILSSIAVSKDTMRPSKGYWGFSTMPSYLLELNWESAHKEPPKSIQDQRESFWIAEVKSLYQYWEKN